MACSRLEHIRDGGAGGGLESDEGVDLIGTRLTPSTAWSGRRRCPGVTLDVEYVKQPSSAG